MTQAVGTPLPAWLAPVGDPVALREEQYARIFERVLEWVENGDTVTDFFAQEQRDIDVRAFRKWVNRSQDRVRRMHEAKKLGCEALEDKIIRIAEGNDLSDFDVERAKLKTANTRWLMTVWNRDRYGESKKIDISSTIDIRANIEAAKARLIQAEVLEITQNSAVESNE